MPDPSIRSTAPCACRCSLFAEGLVQFKLNERGTGIQLGLNLSSRAVDRSFLAGLDK